MLAPPGACSLRSLPALLPALAALTSPLLEHPCEERQLVAVCYLFRRRYPHTIFTIENPDAAVFAIRAPSNSDPQHSMTFAQRRDFDLSLEQLAKHPLISALVEAPVTKGGLGMRIMFCTFCYYSCEC